MRVLRRILVSCVSVALVCVGGIGLLHVPAVRDRLAHAGIRWGCPLPLATPAQVEAAFSDATRKDRGDRLAPERPAAGLALGITTLADAARWSERHGIECKRADQGFTLVRCADVPAEVIGEHGAAIELVTLVFDGTNTLRSVDVWRGRLSASLAAEVYLRLAAQLDGSLGAATVHEGSASAAKLAAQFAQVATEYRFSDYVARLSATNIPGKGVAVRTQHIRL